MELYLEGLHIIVDMEHCDVSRLTDDNACKILLEDILTQKELISLGATWHSFDNKAFTANLALSDSHISIHTWPEYGKVFFDVFLSCFKKNNHETTKQLADALVQFFSGQIKNYTELKR